MSLSLAIRAGGFVLVAAVLPLSGGGYLRSAEGTGHHPPGNPSRPGSLTRCVVMGDESRNGLARAPKVRSTAHRMSDRRCPPDSSFFGWLLRVQRGAGEARGPPSSAPFHRERSPRSSGSGCLGSIAMQP